MTAPTRRLATLVAAVAVLSTGATGCSRAVPGAVAPTTEARVAGVDVTTLTCGDFVALDPGTRAGVIADIYDRRGQPTERNQQREAVGSALAESVCQFLPEVVVRELLLGAQGR